MEARRLKVIEQHLLGLQEVCIVAAGRSPVHRIFGELSAISSIDLAANTLAGTLSKYNINTDNIQELYMGNLFSPNLGQNPAKQVAVKSGLSDSANCMILNKLCASGMKAIMLAAMSIAQGSADCAAAGGMESMSNAPYLHPKIRDGLVRGNHKALDSIDHDAFIDPFSGHLPPFISDKVSEKVNISREELDSYAEESYKKASNAWKMNKFVNEVIPIQNQKKAGKIIDKDNLKGGDFDIKKLRPVLKNGKTTAGNSCGLNDGASVIVLCSRKKANEMGWKVLATIVSMADAEQACIDFPLTPSLAIKKALQRASLPINQLDFIEINEAFSSVIVGNSKLLNYDIGKINAYGGGIAMGHPVGSSGCRIVVTLLSVLKQEGGNYGSAAICNGGGGASAIIIKKE
ncbi:unnamed protein product [Blepharisma stoltei]|uniref:Acetyl-CoA acetyltransferase n=1 Tax=Blepharisma stoltei TaxID=1481888 RepID=A0AAU9IHB9_9CILI|nr:unnamed protein product [Blepharisma stoltei]